MLVSTPNGRLVSRFGIMEAIRMIKQAGFDSYDMSLFSVKHFDELAQNGGDWRAEARRVREYADSIGITCNQTHPIFPPVNGDEKDPERYETLLRHLEISSILGAKIAVVHPIQYLYYQKNVEKLKEMNMEFYRGLIPYCEKFNIKIAVENMWRRYYDKHLTIVDSVCSRAEEFCDYIDTINSPWVVACLDIGHVSLVGEDMTRIIHALGPRLQALHVHDTDTVSDLHTLPFHSKIDFEEVTQALADIGYEGDITLESDSFYGNLPSRYQDVYQAAASYMCTVTKTLRCMVEEKKK
ncbi:MAG: sugar phosphate isomerase/epimerase [Clostridia bacterium]|nr:sugar phosphate isomerase/epimerase [Clostridia bacterium]